MAEGSNSYIYIQRFKEDIKKALDGSVVHQYYVGLSYVNGIGTDKDFGKALSWFERSSELRYKHSFYEAGLIYNNPDYSEYNRRKAIEAFQEGVELGCKYCQYTLGDMRYYGRGVNKCVGNAFRLYKLSADQGYNYAQASVALAYYRGHGASKSKENARVWAEKAAEQDNVLGQYVLGMINEDDRNIEQAIRCFEKSANDGHFLSMKRLSLIYLCGEEKYQDEEQGVHWTIKGAINGCALCQYNMYVFYVNGFYLKKNIKKAYLWLKQSAKNGFKLSQYDLGICLRHGYLGVEKNHQESERYLKKSNKQGMTAAQCIQTGLGIKNRADLFTQRTAMEQNIYSDLHEQ